MEKDLQNSVYIVVTLFIKHNHRFFRQRLENLIYGCRDLAARDWYEKEAAEQTWSVRTLQRNVSSQYYYRMLRTQNEDIVEQEMKELTVGYQNDRLEFIKSPVIAEFLGFS